MAMSGVTKQFGACLRLREKIASLARNDDQSIYLRVLEGIRR